MGLKYSIPENSGSDSPSPRILTFPSADLWKAHLESKKESDQLIVIDFFATWCGPCKYMIPIINEFVDKYKDVQFIRIDVDELKEVAKEFNVEAMPTFVLIKKGKPVERLVGARKDQLQKLIEKHK